MCTKSHIFPLISAAGILCSCTVSTHIGGFLSNLGVNEAYNINTAPYLPQDIIINSKTFSSCERKPLNPTPHNMRIYKLGELYYMELYFQYIPIENGLVRSFSYRDGLALHLKTSDPYHPNLKEPPVEAKMVLMNKDCVKNCLQIDVPEVPASATKIIPVDEFDFSQAKRCKPNPRTYDYGGRQNYFFMTEYYPQIPRQRSWYHYILEPVSWPIQAVEYIPDAAIITPYVLIAAPFATVGQIQMQQQIAHPEQSEDKPTKKESR